MTGAKKKILPFFLPMRGCPTACIYCDQYAISGEEAPPRPADIAAALAAFAGGDGAELAYYGGSFTCLPQAEQEAYLDIGRDAIREGKISGVRVSTRPDCVDAGTCVFLRAHGVTTVELGVQSFDDAVLQASSRGYTAATARAACLAVREAGLILGVQLMTGLPQDSAEKSRASMLAALGAGAVLLRVYPTLVLAGTELARLHAAGLYRPQGLAEAVSLCADLLTLSINGGAVMLRMGVHPGPGLEAALKAGPYHPAFGGLVREELRSRQIKALLTDYDAKEAGLLSFPRAELPLVFGAEKRRLLALGAAFPHLALAPRDDLPAGRLALAQDGAERLLDELDFCRAEARRLMARII